ncbi:uncharacterized protein LOC119663839 [Teleopsis dalmanni]|uniref:uncharacterized protein LOC119663839 n=1 Tax=Teleopsis dalmanni TaxID=139649 RepID=UPI0018CF2853|nr:uncharacterized protein LOC119663839 [Teleopsis dalmanni]
MSLPTSNEAAAVQRENELREGNLNRVSVKVPPFWHERPEIWFAQIEAQFAVADITNDATKFNTVVAAIESSVVADVADAVLHPPATGKYSNFKNQILERFGESEQRKIQRLLSEVELGDRRPSQLLNELTALAKDKVSSEFLKSLWLQRLPPQVRAILQTSNVDLVELAKLADRICEAGDYHQLAAVSSRVSNDSNETARLCQRLDQIEQRLSRLDFVGRQPSRMRQSSRRKSRTLSQSSNHSGWCWFHSRFGEQARRCRQPCTFTSNSKSKN